ncbi:amidohydrolase family protein [Candidatus Latescibacterota bacterium]
MIDVNTWLGHWPFQDFAVSTGEALARHLAAEGIDHALVSPVEAALHPDPHLCNRRLWDTVARCPQLEIAPVINPSLPGWEVHLSELTRRGARAVRVLPNYHQYELTDTCAQRLADAMRRSRQVLLVQMRLEDERNQYAPLQIAGVPVERVGKLAALFPDLRIVCLCPYLAEVEQLAAAPGNVHVDLSYTETLSTVAALLERIEVERVLFGSHTPFLYTRAARAKVEAAEVDESAVAAISEGNAERLLKPR